jgi:hypothetical protein
MSKGRGFLQANVHKKTANNEEELKEVLQMYQNSKDTNSTLDSISTRKWQTSVLLNVAFVLAFTTAVVEQQMLWHNNNEPSPECDSLKMFIAFVSCISALGVVRMHYCDLTELKLLRRLPPEVTLWTSGRLLHLTIEVLFNLACSPPFYHYPMLVTIGTESQEIFAYYTLDSFMTIVIILRVYHVIPLFGFYLKVEETSSKVYARMNGVVLDEMFTAKVCLKTQPLVFVAVLSLASCAVFSYICWVFERAYCAPWAEQYTREAEINDRCSMDNINRSANIGDSFWGECEGSV